MENMSNDFVGVFTNLATAMKEITEEIKEIRNQNNQIALSNRSSNEMIEVCGNKLVDQANILKLLNNTTVENTNNIVELKDRMDNLEYSSEITTSQATNIKNTAKDEVLKYLSFGTPEYHKYFKTYILNLYTFLERRCGKAGSLPRTERRYYESVMKGINDWIPNEKELRARRDNKDK